LRIALAVSFAPGHRARRPFTGFRREDHPQPRRLGFGPHRSRARRRSTGVGRCPRLERCFIRLGYPVAAEAETVLARCPPAMSSRLSYASRRTFCGSTVVTMPLRVIGADPGVADANLPREQEPADGGVLVGPTVAHLQSTTHRLISPWKTKN